jgi:hypothetical protein
MPPSLAPWLADSCPSSAWMSTSATTTPRPARPVSHRGLVHPREMSAPDASPVEEAYDGCGGSDTIATQSTHRLELSRSGQPIPSSKSVYNKPMVEATSYPLSTLHRSSPT